MPNERYLKPKQGGDPLSALLYGELKRTRTKFYELVLATGISDSTLRKYFQHPEEAPLDKLIVICKKLGISKATFCQMMEWRSA